MKMEYRMVGEETHFKMPSQNAYPQVEKMLEDSHISKNEYHDVLVYLNMKSKENYALMDITFRDKDALLKYFYNKFNGDFSKIQSEVAKRFELYFSEKDYEELKKTFK